MERKRKLHIEKEDKDKNRNEKWGRNIQCLEGEGPWNGIEEKRKHAGLTSTVG